jgi:hypothetical protein
MRFLPLVALALVLGCTAPVEANPDYQVINGSVEMLLRDGVTGESEVRYIPENPARGDSYSLSYSWCSDGICRVLVDLRVYWMSNYDKTLDLEVYTDYNGNVLNYTVVSEQTVVR